MMRRIFMVALKANARQLTAVSSPSSVRRACRPTMVATVPLRQALTAAAARAAHHDAFGANPRQGPQRRHQTTPNHSFGVLRIAPKIAKVQVVVFVVHPQ